MILSRPPHGGRGLKSDRPWLRPYRKPSSPSRGTWIEIYADLAKAYGMDVVPLTGDVD